MPKVRYNTVHERATRGIRRPAGRLHLETAWNEKHGLLRQRNLWALAFFLLVIDVALWFSLSHYNWLWVNGTALACGTCAIESRFKALETGKIR